MEKRVENPVLRGFHPDPSLLRVGEDYYIATSTFEWFPGICLHHSRDLENWERIGYALTREEDLPLRGIDSSCGIWAPNLTYSEGIFYLVYTIVYTDRHRFKDTHNFLITAKDIHGPWSEPVTLNRSGFDPSLFHAPDGKKWLVNMYFDYRNDHKRFGGVVIQEYDSVRKRLCGEVKNIFPGTEIGTTEGPNIFFYKGYYYLVMAEGGTEFGHCVSMARARTLSGPYEACPYNPVLSSVSGENRARLTRAGHGQLVCAPSGEWYMAHLCSRSVEDCSILGRETAIQNMEYTKDGWFRLLGGGVLPENSFCVSCTAKEKTGKDAVAAERTAEASQSVGEPSEETLLSPYLTLREPRERLGIRLAAGKILIQGGNSLASKYDVHLLARKQEELYGSFSACLRFAPENPNQMAGIVCYYNYDNYYYLYVTRLDDGRIAVGILTSLHGRTESFVHWRPEKETELFLRAELGNKELRFFASEKEEKAEPVGEILDMRQLSDERIRGNGFTGAMLGICCQDLSGEGCEAEFSVPEYKKEERRG